jgi:hypothetical protein
LKEGLNNLGLAFVWRTQQECNLREITKIVEDRFKDNKRQNILRIIQEKSGFDKVKFIYRMFKERNKLDSVVACRGVGVESNGKKHR